MTGLLQDLRYAARQLRKAPGFTFTSVLTLALGIGATVAVFSVMNAVLLNPSGIPHPENVVALRAKYAMGDLANINFSPTDFGDAVTAKNIFTSAAVMQGEDFNYSSGDSTPQRLSGAEVSWQWFDVFWARPHLGRVFRPEEDEPEANHVAVLSYRTWRRVFGGDESIVGRTLQLNDESYKVIGVMGPNFAWPNQAELWIPIGLPPGSYFDPRNRNNEYLFAVARRRPGVSLAQANAYLHMRADQDIAAQGAQAWLRTSGWGMFCMPLIEFVSGSLRQPLLVLLAAVATILLIICANIAGLQLARASGRQRELSIQIALGAGSYRLAQQALMEGLCLSIAGAALGLMLARILIPLLLLLAPPDVMLNLAVHIGKPVLLLLVALATLCALLCGVAPAWQLARGNWFHALQEGGRSDASSRGRQRLRSGLVIAEIAMAMVLLLASGLLVRSLRKLEEVKTGFDPSGVMSAELSLPAATYQKDEQQAAFYRSLEEQLNHIPGLTHAALTNALPFTNMGGSASFRIEGQTLAPDDPGPHGNHRSVSPDYFATLRIPLLRGRVFTEQDRLTTEHVCVIDDTLARRYWPGADPIGQHIQFSFRPHSPWVTIVGIVGHAKASSLKADTTEGFYYMPLAQETSSSVGVLVRTNGNPESMADGMRAAARAIDPNLPLYDFKTMQERVEASLTGQRFLVVLLSIFAGLALALAALGLYGIISYTVRLRNRELGVRIALGATRQDVLRLVLRYGVRLACVGFAIGIAMTLVLGRMLASLLYHVSLLNSLALITSSFVLAITILLACYIPARRAANVDPMVALRYE
ncbi:MAG TPA: ABC transporter permease [Terriglobales bacterium]|nr:ABC transporter permease [Terriglobales bacterium]